jgi:hypothetical protein
MTRLQKSSKNLFFSRLVRKSYVRNLNVLFYPTNTEANERRIFFIIFRSMNKSATKKITNIYERNKRIEFFCDDFYHIAWVNQLALFNLLIDEFIIDGPAALVTHICSSIIADFRISSACRSIDFSRRKGMIIPVLYL